MAADAPPTLSSKEAAAWLGIKLETLYAYASRGLVKGLPGARGRGRRYRREDLEPLRVRSAGPAAGALRFGEPVLETGITRITPGGPAYRGRLATDLVREGRSFEAVAEGLWTGQWPAEGPRSARQPRPAPGDAALPAREMARLLAGGGHGAHGGHGGRGARRPGSSAAAPAVPSASSTSLAPVAPAVLMAPMLALPVLAAADPLRFDAEPAAVLARARRLLPCLAASFALVVDARRLPAALATADPALALARALGLRETAKVMELLRATLVLCADHELNASTFAARVAASTGADLHACLAAALAAFSGPRHGGASEQVELLAREAGTPARAALAVGERLRRGERLPGFGHPLYPAGDPRAAPIIERAVALAPRSLRLRTVLALADAVQATGRPAPNVDIGIAAACAALDLPIGLGPAIFAVGRSAGWVAHVLEQQASPAVLRPRARYVGEGGGEADAAG